MRHCPLFSRFSMLITMLALLLTTEVKAQPAPPTETCGSPTISCEGIAELLNEREGYGRFAQGGLNGKFALVTSNADSGYGSLRDILSRATGPLWIRFASDMVIDLRSQINLKSDVTIDGRGRSVTLHDWGLTLSKNVHNIIVTHITIDGRFTSESQAVNIAPAHDVWIDHLTLRRTNDRLINVKSGATNVTLSWLRFEQHNKVMLFNNLDEDLFKFYERDSQLRVTLHHSYFVDTVQRNPRAQMGTSHIFNNLLEDWDFYGMSFSLEHRALIEGNIFSNTSNRRCKELGSFKTIEKIDRNYCKSVPMAPLRTALPNGEADRAEFERGKEKYHYNHDWRAFLVVRDNLYLGDSRPVLSDYRPENVPTPPYCYSYDRPSEALAQRIRVGAGNRYSPPVRGERRCPAGVAPVQ